MNEQQLAQLERISKLRAEGALTDVEFKQQKAQITGSMPRPTLPKKKLTIGRIILYVFLGMVALGFIGTLMEGPPAPQSPQQKASADSLARINEANKKLYDNLQNGRYYVKELVKDNLKDPDSYDEIDHKEVIVDNKKTYIQCQLKYRAKNSFGGFNVETVYVNFNRDMVPIKTWTE